MTSFSQNGRFLPVFLSTSTAVKLQDVISRVHLSRIKPVSTDTLQEPEDPHSSHPCETAPFSKSPQDQGDPGENSWKFQVDEWATPRLEALIQKGQKDFLASGWVPIATVFLLPSGTPIDLQINRDALVDLVNYCLLCSHLHSWNLLNFSAHTGWFNYDPDWCNLLLFSY